jgi:sarcosine oxidase
MSQTSDIIVVGLGAMGSAALYHLARAGVRVVGFDKFTPPHSYGSTHGLSRIIREAYYEHPLYVPLVQRAYELWAELESASGRTLFRRTSGLMIGPRDGALVGGARRSAAEHSLRAEELSASDVGKRFPAFRVPAKMVALLEPRAGVLDPESCVDTHLILARRAGADLHTDEPVLRWRGDAGTIGVTTTKGDFVSRRLVLCAGAWTPALVDDDTIPLRVERQVMHWFTPRRHPELFTPERMPIAMIEYAPERFFYTLPDSGAGVKVALHHEGLNTDPEHVDRRITAVDVDRVSELVRQFLPHAAGALRHSATCLYTNTPDYHFLIDAHPRHNDVLVVSACSGHGFKFASAIGEIVADLMTDKSPRFNLRPFAFGARH